MAHLEPWTDRYLRRKSFASLVIDALVKFAAEELNAQNGKDQPEYQTDEQHVENGRNGEHQSVDDNLSPVRPPKHTHINQIMSILNVVRSTCQTFLRPTFNKK